MTPQIAKADQQVPRINHIQEFEAYDRLVLDKLNMTPQQETTYKSLERKANNYRDFTNIPRPRDPLNDVVAVGGIGLLGFNSFNNVMTKNGRVEGPDYRAMLGLKSNRKE